MKPSRPKQHKRPRDSSLSSDDDAAESASELVNPDQRPGQAERKRELERNRRNLINVRFAELDVELRHHAPTTDDFTLSYQQQQATKTKRIDKEAVLKEATQRLGLHRKDLSAQQERIKAMTLEIENLRIEKVELRNDKAYLRSELDNVRGDVQRLRSDNINLWQAVRKASTFKSSLSADVAKLPADLFLRPRPTESLAQPTTTTAKISSPRLHPSSPVAPIRTTAPSSTPTTATVQNMLSSLAQSPPAPAPPPHLAPTLSTPTIPTSTSQPAVCLPSTSRAQPSAPRETPSAPTTHTLPTYQSCEPFLVLQSPGELGQLINTYLSASNGNLDSNASVTTPQIQTHSQPLMHPQSSRPTAMSLSTHLSHPTSTSIPFSSPLNPEPIKGSDNDENNQPVPLFQEGEDDDTSVKADDDLFSDIAYCV